MPRFSEDAWARTAALRAAICKPERPAVAIFTSGASLAVSHPVVAGGALVLTTPLCTAHLSDRNAIRPKA